MRRGGPAIWIVLGGTVLLVALTAPLAGPVPVAPGKLLGALLHPGSTDPVAVRILALRLPRVALGLLVGASLALSGAAFQTLLGNPLATPYTVGVAAAGSFGAFLALAAETWRFLGPAGSVPAMALAFAVGELALLAALARRARWGRTALVLAGVTFNFLFAGATLFVRLLAEPFTLQAMDRWLMGGLDVVGWGPVARAGLLGLPAAALLLASGRVLDQLALGETVAHGRGVAVGRWRALVLGAGAWLTAAAVAQAGPIAFIGLVVPHAVRRFVGAAHGRVLPASLVAGAGTLVLADALARTLRLPGSGAELPVGLVTALVGGPIFLLLLARATRGAR